MIVDSSRTLCRVFLLRFLTPSSSGSRLGWSDTRTIQLDCSLLWSARYNMRLFPSANEPHEGGATKLEGIALPLSLICLFAGFKSTCRLAPLLLCVRHHLTFLLRNYSAQRAARRARDSSLVANGDANGAQNSASFRARKT